LFLANGHVRRTLSAVWVADRLAGLELHAHTFRKSHFKHEGCRLECGSKPWRSRGLRPRNPATAHVRRHHVSGGLARYAIGIFDVLWSRPGGFFISTNPACSRCFTSLSAVIAAMKVSA
jgi:hypothetical protein